MRIYSIHNLNSFLIIFSTIIAFLLPFELFLFSYIILGPLHYLTEINWLHQRNYFTKGKFDFLFLVVGCFTLVYWNYKPPEDHSLIADVIMLSFLFSIGLVFIQNWFLRCVLLCLTLIFVAIINNSPDFFIWVALFVPTIIHVFIFTWAFMLYGVLKERSTEGFVCIALLIICSILLVTIRAEGYLYVVSEKMQRDYMPFAFVNFQFINWFHLDELSYVKQVFTTKAGIVAMRFIAFAYTYHYLNWFSKTTVIKWHQVPKLGLTTILLLWVLSIVVYVYDNDLGFNLLLTLSLLHVFLEFPLNVVSFVGIGKSILSLTRGKAN